MKRIIVENWSWLRRAAVVTVFVLGAVVVVPAALAQLPAEPTFEDIANVDPGAVAPDTLDVVGELVKLGGDAVWPYAASDNAKYSDLALEALVRLKDRRVTEVVLTRFTSLPGVALYYLLKLEDPAAEPRVSEWLGDDALWPHYRMMAAEWLLRFGSAAAKQTATEYILNEQEVHQQHADLASQSQQQGTPYPARPPFVEWARALVELGTEDALGIVAKLFAESTNAPFNSKLQVYGIMLNPYPSASTARAALWLAECPDVMYRRRLHVIHHLAGLAALGRQGDILTRARVEQAFNRLPEPPEELAQWYDKVKRLLMLEGAASLSFIPCPPYGLWRLP